MSSVDFGLQQQCRAEWITALCKHTQQQKTALCSKDRNKNHSPKEPSIEIDNTVRGELIDRREERMVRPALL